MASYEAFAGTLTTDMNTLSRLITTQNRYLQNLKTASRILDGLIAKLPAVAANSGSSQPRSTGPSTSSRSSGPAGNGGIGTGSDSGRASSGQSGNGSGNPSGKSGQPTTQPANAAQLTADQGAIDAAQAALVVDQQKLTVGTLTSPISGTVAAVGMTAGGSPSGQAITILGQVIQQADIAVPLGEIDLVKVGQRATLTADGTARQLHGTVHSVGLLSSTSGSSTTFPVTVELDPDSPALFDGSGADVTISTATAKNVLTVPNSAIHTSGNGRHTVTVVAGSKTTTVPVTVGVTGSAISQISSGLKAGQRVVLADLAQQLPSSSTSSNTGTLRSRRGRRTGRCLQPRCCGSPRRLAADRRVTGVLGQYPVWRRL